MIFGGKKKTTGVNTRDLSPSAKAVKLPRLGSGPSHWLSEYWHFPGCCAMEEESGRTPSRQWFHAILTTEDPLCRRDRSREKVKGGATPRAALPSSTTEIGTTLHTELLVCFSSWCRCSYTKKPPSPLLTVSVSLRGLLRTGV